MNLEAPRNKHWHKLAYCCKYTSMQKWLAQESLMSDPAYVVDGDVTDALFEGQDATGKKALCESLNREAKRNSRSPRSSCPSCRRNRPHPLGRCRVGGGSESLRGKLLARWFARAYRVFGLYTVFPNPEQGGLDKDFV